MTFTYSRTERGKGPLHGQSVVLLTLHAESKPKSMPPTRTARRRADVEPLLLHLGLQLVGPGVRVFSSFHTMGRPHTYRMPQLAPQLPALGVDALRDLPLPRDLLVGQAIHLPGTLM